MKAYVIWAMFSGLMVLLGFSYVVPTSIPKACADHTTTYFPYGSNERMGVLFVAPGVTEPRSRAIQLTSAVAGQIRSINVQAGDAVRAKDVLAELDDDVQVTNVRGAEAKLDGARAELTRLELGDRPMERAILRAELEEAEAALKLAEFEAARMDNIKEQHAVTEQEVASTQFTVAQARARRDVAKNRWSISNEGARPDDLARASAAVRAAQAELSSAQALLEMTRIRSPIDGMVIYRYREPGEMVLGNATTPVLSVGDCSRLRVRVDVDESDIGKVWIGQEVDAGADAFGERRFPGRVVHIEPTLGAKNFRTNRPTERIDTRVQEVVVEVEAAQRIPMELQMMVWFFEGSDAQPAEVASNKSEAKNTPADPFSGIPNLEVETKLLNEPVLRAIN